MILTNPPINERMFIQGDTLSNSWVKFFQNLSKNSLESYILLTYLDTDTTLAANSDTKIATQKAVKTYVDNFVISNECIFATGTAVNAVNAQGTVSFVSNPAVSSIITIGSHILTFNSTRTNLLDIQLGSTAEGTAINLATTINTDLTDFTAEVATTTVVVTAVVAGVAGNSNIFTTTSAGLTLDGSGYLGGTTAGVNGTVGDRPVIDDNYLYILVSAENTIVDKNWRKIPLTISVETFNLNATLGTQ